MEKISFERRAYESVDDKRLSYRYISKTNGKKVLCCNRLRKRRLYEQHGPGRN